MSACCTRNLLRRKLNDRGESLVETSVAFLVLTIVVLSFSAMVMFGLRLSSEAEAIDGKGQSEEQRAKSGVFGDAEYINIAYSLNGRTYWGLTKLERYEGTVTTVDYGLLTKVDCKAVYNSVKDADQMGELSSYWFYCEKPNDMFTYSEGDTYYLPTDALVLKSKMEAKSVWEKISRYHWSIQARTVNGSLHVWIYIVDTDISGATSVPKVRLYHVYSDGSSIQSEGKLFTSSVAVASYPVQNYYKFASGVTSTSPILASVVGSGKKIAAPAANNIGFDYISPDSSQVSADGVNLPSGVTNL